jgi:hypothetical protein
MRRVKPQTKMSWRALTPLFLGCTVAATVFSFGADVFAFRSTFEGTGRTQLILLTRLIVLIALAAILVFRAEWRGVAAAIAMIIVATALEWLLFPLAFDWAATADPEGYGERFGDVGRPPYASIAVYDILGVGISSALAQGLRMMARVNPQGPRDE